MISMDEARARVAKGAAHLDEFWPGWHKDIELKTLDMSGDCNCVIGQLTGSYNDHLEHVLPKVMERRQSATQRGVDYGFDVEKHPIEAYRKEEFRRLQDAWVEAIAEREVRETTSGEIIADRERGTTEIEQPVVSTRA